MTAWPLIPGVPAAGHVARNGAWHPGPIAGCRKCPEPERFRCPRCGMTSAHPTDLAEGYCGNCHDWTGRRR